MVQAPANHNGLIEITLAQYQKPKLSLPIHGAEIPNRINPLLRVGQLAVNKLSKEERTGLIAIQVHDEDPGLPCLRFDAPINDHLGPPLIPDPYCLATQGYSELIKEFEINNPLPNWQEKLNKAFWRGSTTGLSDLNESNLETLPRYILCRLSNQRKTLLDAKFTALVQTRSANQKQKINKHLIKNNLFSPRTSPWHGALHRWLIDIDGNVNSWGLLWKLLSGSCVIRVASKRVQWYHHLLIPMEHFIPIKNDLSNLEEQLIWCRENNQYCEQIANNGKILAKQIINNLETDIDYAIKMYSKNWLGP